MPLPDAPPLTTANASAAFDQFSELAQAAASAARNIANADELREWLSELLESRFGPAPESEVKPPRQTACERWARSVARNWMIRQGQSEPHTPSGEALERSPAWVRQALAQGAAPQRLTLAPSEREALAGALDWMRSDHGPALASDWSRISVPQALAAEKAWIDAMAKAALKKDLDVADAAGTTLFAESPALGPDGRSGWRWVEVQSKDALDREGSLMRHCVGSYAEDVALDRKSIFSLRDPDNQPRLTLETQQGKIAQLKAFANQPCPPELLPRFADFARAFEPLCHANAWPVKVSREAEEAGVFSLPFSGFELAVLGEPLPPGLLPRIAMEISQGHFVSAEALPAFAALGWTDPLRLALPHASSGLRDQALVNAAERGQLLCVELLIPAADPKANDSQALSLAAHHGHREVAKLLIPVSDPKADDSRALLEAVENGDLPMAELLLPHSDPKARNSFALSMAASHGRLALVELLLPFCDAQDDRSGALTLAAKHGHREIVELLLPNPEPKALVWAARYGQLEIVELLIQHSDPKANDSEALCWAASNGHRDVAELLIPLSDLKADGSRALIWAAGNGQLEMVELLLPHCDPKSNDFDALLLAASKGHRDVVELLLPLSNPEINASRALLCAARKGRREVVELLLPCCPLADQARALSEVKASYFPEVASLIQASIAAATSSRPPELSSIGRNLRHARQPQPLAESQPSRNALS